MAYTVPKLKSYSAEALEKAAEKLLAALEAEAKAVNSEEDWKVFRDRWMARKNGILTQVNDLWLKSAPKEAKRETGQRVNEIRRLVTERVEQRSATGHVVGIAASIQVSGRVEAHVTVAPPIDITLPGIRRPIGAEHPVVKTMNELVAVFRDLGYSVEEGPEIETDYYNF